MKITQLHDEPPVYLIKELYTEKDRLKIMRELLFLQPKLGYAEGTNPAIDDTNEVLTSKTGFFLEDIYLDRGISDILTINRTNYDIIVNELDHWYFSFSAEYKDFTLLSYYEEADYYKPHRDKSFLTAVSWFYQKPKNFIGGDLELPELNITIPCEDNTMVMFPGGLVTHTVPKINIIDKSREQSGRFAISQFFHLTGSD